MNTTMPNTFFNLPHPFFYTHLFQLSDWFPLIHTFITFRHNPDTNLHFDLASWLPLSLQSLRQWSLRLLLQRLSHQPLQVLVTPITLA